MGGLEVGKVPNSPGGPFPGRLTLRLCPSVALYSLFRPPAV